LDSAGSGRQEVFDIGSIGWQHTIPVMALLLSLIFRKPLSTKILQLRGLRRKGKELELQFTPERENVALPEPGTPVVGPSDVLEELKKIEWFTEQEIQSILTILHRTLVLNGIITRPQLSELVTSRYVLNTLTALYVRYLDRDTKAPFDPVALVSYGPALLLDKDKDDVVRRITVVLIFSKEYKEKQRQKRLSKGRIAGEQRGDYLHFICSDCGNHVDCRYKGYDPAMPYFDFKCPKCGNSGSLKLMGMHWKGLPTKPYEPNSVDA
jgi:predicted RNA-binding Zn-ribbon protein involved in translation (DUF1610 family)